MRCATGYAIIIGLVLLFLWSGAAAQNTPKYDSATETKLKGTVDEVKQVPSAKGEPAIHLMVRSGSDVLEVYLCPNAFLQEMEMAFAKGDQVEVTGSKVKVGDAQVILAKDVTKGNDTLVLRDKNGAPVWLPPPKKG